MRLKGYNSDFGTGGNSGSDSLENGRDYNSAGSSSVGKVDSVNITVGQHSLSLQGASNSVTQNYKDGKLNSERYYDSNGNAYLDIDYSNHGNPKMHPKVPHQHKITYINGEPHRDSTDTEVK